MGPDHLLAAENFNVETSSVPYTDGEDKEQISRTPTRTTIEQKHWKLYHQGVDCLETSVSSVKNRKIVNLTKLPYHKRNFPVCLRHSL